MKIGILTFHRAENFGAALQAYALQKTLEKMGHDTEFIDFRCSPIERTYDIFSPQILISRKNIFKSFKSYLYRFAFLKSRIRKKRRYNYFRSKFLKISSHKYLHINRNYDYNVYITGSDQVWNFMLTNGISKEYFLAFQIRNNAKRISYAVSSEDKYYNLYQRNEKLLTEYLNNFTHISVRENSLKIELQKYTNKNIAICLDPTFLLEKSDYKEIMLPPQNKNYILIYYIFESNEAKILANKISKDKNLEIIEIHADFLYTKEKGNHLYHLGPQEILGYINNAEYVITTSFHGLALSLILEKEIWLIDKGTNNRIKSLLKILQIENRIIKGEDIKATNIKEKLNYTNIKQSIKRLTDNSITFLTSSIND